MNAQTPPPPPSPEARPVGQTTSTGLDPKLAGLLCYILSPLTGIVFFLIEKANPIVRFHAAQSIVFGIGAVIVWVALVLSDRLVAGQPVHAAPDAGRHRALHPMGGIVDQRVLR